MSIKPHSDNPFSGVLTPPINDDPMEIDDDLMEIETKANEIIKKFPFSNTNDRPYVTVDEDIDDFQTKTSVECYVQGSKINSAVIDLSSSFFSESVQAQEFILAHEIAHLEQFSEPPSSLGEATFRTLAPYNNNVATSISALSLGTILGTMIGGLRGTIPWRTVCKRSPLALPFFIKAGVDYFSRKHELDADRRAVYALQNCNGGIEFFSKNPRFEEYITLPFSHTHPTHSARLAQLKKIQKEFE